MTLETKQEKIHISGETPEDNRLMTAIAVGVAASEAFGVLHDLEDYDVWEEPPENDTVIDGAKEEDIFDGLKLITPSVDTQNPSIVISSEELPYVIDAVDEARELIEEGKVINISDVDLVETEAILMNAEFDLAQAA